MAVNIENDNKSSKGEQLNDRFVEALLLALGGSMSSGEPKLSKEAMDKLSDLAGKLNEMLDQLQGLVSENENDTDDEPDDGAIGETGFDLYNWSFTQGKRARGNGWTIAIPDGFVQRESRDDDSLKGQKRPFELVPVTCSEEDSFGEIPIRILPGIITEGQGTKMIHPEALAGVAGIIGVTLCETMSKMMGVSPALLSVGWDDLSACIMIQDTSEGSYSYQCSVFEENRTQQLRIQTLSISGRQKHKLEASIQAWLKTMRYDSDSNSSIVKSIFEENACYDELLKGNTAEFEDAVIQARTEYVTSVNGKIRMLEYMSENGLLDKYAGNTIKDILEKGMEVKLFFLEKADRIIDKLLKDNADPSLLKSVLNTLDVLDEDFLDLQLDDDTIRVEVPEAVQNIRDKWKNIAHSAEIKESEQPLKAVPESNTATPESEIVKAEEELKPASGKTPAETKTKEEAIPIAERLAEEKRISKKSAAKKRGWRIFAFATFDLALVALAFVFIRIVIPLFNYNSALTLYQNGRYEEAIVAFEAMDGYKDSAMQIEACREALKDIEIADAFAKAAELMNSGKYEEAIAAYEALNVYKDNTAQIEACQTAMKGLKYDSALELMNSEKYEEAIAVFNTMKGYKDSYKKISYCSKAIKERDYAAALELLNDGNYAEAYEKLIALNGYKNSAKKAKEIFVQYESELVKAAQIGESVYFGSYEQDNNTSNGKESIEWLVLAIEEDKMLVISKYALSCRPYNEAQTDVTWESCTLRSWLNESFLNEAFSAEELAQIQIATVAADMNSKHNTNPGNATEDKVFLLSCSEADKYLNSASLVCVPTAYAKALGALTGSDNKTDNGEDLCWWWLRTPGSNQRCAVVILLDGSIYYDGNYISDVTDCVRPAMWISIAESNQGEQNTVE